MRLWKECRRQNGNPVQPHIFERLTLAVVNGQVSRQAWDQKGCHHMSADYTSLILRLALGLLLAGHGAQKLFGWFGGPGPSEVANWLSSMGFRHAPLWAFLAGLVEFGGGLLFILGLFNPLGSLGILASMLTAAAKVHWPKLWIARGGFEYVLLISAIVIILALQGPGRFSLDAVWGTALPGIWSFVALTVVLLGWILALADSYASPRL